MSGHRYWSGEKWKFLFVDRNNNGLLCTTPTRTVGQNLLGGILDARVIEIPLHREMYKKYEALDYENGFLRVSPTREITELPAGLVTEDFLAKRKQASARAKYLELLEMISFLSTSKEYLSYPAPIYPILENELRDCQPQHGIFSNGIHEYAIVHEIEPSVAYEEISFVLRGARTIAMRDFAIFQKYVRTFNTCDLTELPSFYQKLREEVFLSAST